MSTKPAIDPPDTILEEIHETRRQLLRKHGGVAGLAAFLRKQEAKASRDVRAPESPAGTTKRVRRRRKKPADES
jgi:hypothetical protein